MASYRAAYPDGPDVDPLVAAESTNDTGSTGWSMHLATRVSDPEFLNDVARQRELTARRAELREAAKVARENGDGASYRELSAEARETFFEEMTVRARVDQYRAETAALLEQDVTDPYAGVDERCTIGTFAAEGTAPTDTAGLVALSRTGIDGDDAGALLFAAKPRRVAIADAKSSPDPVESIDAGPYDDITRAWKPVIARKFAEEHPELAVLSNDQVYRDTTTPWKVATFDATLRSDGAEDPDGVLICVTSGSAEAWERGIPTRQRMVALHDMHAAGASYGYVAVVVDDHRYRSFRIEADEPVDVHDPHRRMYSDYQNALRNEWEGIEAKRESRAFASPGGRKYLFKHTGSGLSQAAAFRGEPVALSEARYSELRSEGLDEDGAYRRLYAEGRKGDSVYVDLETTTFTPDSGEIVEIGMVRRDERGNEVARYQEIFAVDARFAAVRGTGPQDIHQISVTDTAGKRPFAQAAPDVRRFLGIGTDQPVTVVGHNSLLFERAWLDSHLPGFHEARQQPADPTKRPQVHEFDTMHIAQRAVRSTKSSSLRAFVERFGGRYEGAHRALVDSTLTADALEAFTREAQAAGVADL